MPLEPATRPKKIYLSDDKGLDDLRRLKAVPRKKQTVSERRSREKPRLASTDRRLMPKADPRNIQFASNTTMEVDSIWRESTARWDLTKADFLERAIRLLAKTLDERGGVWEDEQGERI